MKYYGITYPKILDNRLTQWLWRKTFCKIGWHLGDECKSPDDHGMSCDACELWAEIKYIDTDYVRK
jgi:hypothetical protein